MLTSEQRSARRQRARRVALKMANDGASGPAATRVRPARATFPGVGISVISHAIATSSQPGPASSLVPTMGKPKKMLARVRSTNSTRPIGKLNANATTLPSSRTSVSSYRPTRAAHTVRKADIAGHYAPPSDRYTWRRGGAADAGDAGRGARHRQEPPGQAARGRIGGA